jgi:hypothetical protein
LQADQALSSLCRHGEIMCKLRIVVPALAALVSRGLTCTSWTMLTLIGPGAPDAAG